MRGQGNKLSKRWLEICHGLHIYSIGALKYFPAIGTHSLIITVGINLTNLQSF